MTWQIVKTNIKGAEGLGKGSDQTFIGSGSHGTLTGALQLLAAACCNTSSSSARC